MGALRSQGAKRWVEEKGMFIPLDQYYDQVTYLEPVYDGSKGNIYRKIGPLPRGRPPAWI